MIVEEQRNDFKGIVENVGTETGENKEQTGALNMKSCLFKGTTKISNIFKNMLFKYNCVSKGWIF